MASPTATSAPLPAARPRSWRARFRSWRNGLIADPAFQRWAAAFPLTRPIARRRAEALFDLVSGFVSSQVLAAVVKLRLVDFLAGGPQPLATIAAAHGLGADAASRLCTAATALELLTEVEPGVFALGDLGAALRGQPGVVAMIEHHGLLYDDLRDPVALLRGEVDTPNLARFWRYASVDAPGRLQDDAVAAYSRLMAASQAFIADEVLDAYPMDRHRRLLDVGGGEGAFVEAALRRTPGLQATVFDLPAVADRARARLTASGLGDRFQAAGGDLFADRLPDGADIATLVRVLYDHPDARAAAILSAVHAALPPGSTLLVAEPMAGLPAATRSGAVYFPFYLLAMQGGRCRTPAELVGLIKAAGFSEAAPRATRSPLLTGLIVARR